MNNKEIPKEAIQASKIIEELLDSILVGIYLYGSAVMGGDKLCVEQEKVGRAITRIVLEMQI